eukprot:TRINITY_DN10314_c0_g1_i2.p1 TRINITY_DN10314_c0_g1~~TRINITY_DN10314_c0_g1_i2.p1  ORF type:complete len:301 (+),score=69.39 TRINITY_DN10314_c0_g1_i2:11-913(+)
MRPLVCTCLDRLTLLTVSWVYSLPVLCLLSRLYQLIDVICFLFFFNDTATTEIYTLHIVGSVRCVQETVSTQSTWGIYQLFFYFSKKVSIAKEKMQFNFEQIQGLKQMILGDEEENDDMVQNYNKGSVLNPGQIDRKDEKKEVAKPYTKIQFKPGEKPQNIQEEKKKQNDQQKKFTKNDIWDEKDVKDLPISKNDTRPQPEIEVLFKQNVGTEDVYLGLSNMDPTSTKCQELLIKIKLPDTQYKEISLDVNKNAIVLQCPKYYLHHVLPYTVKDKEGKAKWISDKCILEITFPIIREDDF